jgi:hypothetical protein
MGLRWLRGLLERQTRKLFKIPLASNIMCLGCKLHLNRELVFSKGLRYEGGERGGFAVIRMTGCLSLQGHKLPQKNGEWHALSFKKYFKCKHVSYWDHFSGALRRYEN